MKLQLAQQIATLWMHKLQPYCDRIAIAGSIRREAPDVKDIELVCIPRVVRVGTEELFTGSTIPAYERHQGFINEIQPVAVSGNLKEGRYIKLHLPEHQINIDVFTAAPLNWGYILAIRTGSADYSHHVLANGWVKKGYKGIDGMLTRDGRPVEVKEEADLFRLIGVPYQHPTERNLKIDKA